MTQQDDVLCTRKAARVDELRALIQAGDYSVPATEVADAILRHARGRGKVARLARPVSDPAEDG